MFGLSKRLSERLIQKVKSPNESYLKSLQLLIYTVFQEKQDTKLMTNDNPVTSLTYYQHPFIGRLHSKSAVTLLHHISNMSLHHLVNY